MSDGRGRSSYSHDDRSSRRTSSRAPSRTRREPSRDRSRTSSSLSLSSGPGPDSGRSPRYYPPPAGSRPGSGASSQQPLLSRRGSTANSSDYRSGPSLDLPVYVGDSETTSKASLIGGSSSGGFSSSSGSVPLPRRDPISVPRRRGSRHELDDGRPLHPHDLPPSRPPSSNPARPLTSSGGSVSRKHNDPTAPGQSYPDTPSWAQGSTRLPFTTVSNYPNHGHPSASQSLSPSNRGDNTRARPPIRPIPLPVFTTLFTAEPDQYAASNSSSNPSTPYTRSPGRAGHTRLPSDPRHPGEIVVPSNSSGLSQAQSRPSDYSGREPRAASPYVLAATAERRQTEQRSALGGWPARGGSNPSIGADYTQASHQRLADVARRSADEWGRKENLDAVRVERNQSRQSSHKKYAESMERDRESDEERRRRRS
ncbi:uncharacterized protein C8A04DRAFT_24597 [Dichotomopilus funicola]|uniref:Uncharacterized protein n=1 Tax=Dichotomopilus funicola TaxID=1934379 RepID=A0AAN6V9R1_9PEZI|nr:hypothetical protein C8A04DRAFT_24597 [Dichotomopilus funicola]